MNVNDLFKASFGFYGSVYLNGDGAQLDLDGATANRFIISITMLEDTTFEDIQTLDGVVSSITDVSTELDVGGAFGACLCCQSKIWYTSSSKSIVIFLFISPEDIVKII